MSTPIFPVDYKRLTDIVMALPLTQCVEPELEPFGHPIREDHESEFDEKRGIFADVYGWKIFWDKVGTFQPEYLYNLGHIYDAENGLGYIGDMINVDGKPCPFILTWAMRTRLKHPRKEGKFKIDKTDAIYYYESLDMC